ncbi:TetR/AcrR family transcriptional regulator [Amycolatopsis anabasis]|uniref:TetR/AcrR family transcriptional regulator n=1 Tax=Amycolatopsis anabasis TaxID=1840409 RepID=UPI00131E79CE|nr:TetR/AcrR family transcriptional regulator [Amycolatopsis anabasis]
MEGQTAGVVRRPRDRKARIVAAAAAQFHERGYHRVTMEDIAAAVGVTVAAVYRHFQNKSDLLAGVVLGGIELFTEAVETSTGHLDDMLRTLAHLAMERRELGTLWRRESRYLPAPERERARSLLWDCATRVTTAVRDARPELADRDADLLAWTVLSVLAGPSTRALQMPRRKGEQFLHQTTARVCARYQPPPEPAATSTPETSGAPPLRPVTRREALLAVAVDLFGQHGYEAVSMADIGAAAGVTGASVYKHFAVKADLLAALAHRAIEGHALELSRALTASSTAPEALTHLLRSKVGLTLAHPALTAVLVTEADHLPTPHRDAVEQALQDYLAEWAHLLHLCRPQLAKAERRGLVGAVISVIQTLGVAPHLRARPGFDQDLITLGAHILDHG